MKQKVVWPALLMGLLVSIRVVSLIIGSGGEVLAAKLKDEAQNIPAPQGQISPREYAARRKREANEYLAKGEWQKAVEVYDDIANKHPFTDQELIALSEKAHVYWAGMEKRTEAASTYRLLAERAAHMIVELQMRRARAISDQAIHGPTRGDPAILQEAVEEYRLIVDKFPGEKDAVFKAQTKILGLYRRLGEKEKALQLCKELAALPENQSGSRSVEVLSQLGFCYTALERWQDAEKVWLEAIQQNPDYDYGRIMIDVVYRKLGKPEKAEEQYLTIVHRAREEKRKSKAYCYIGRLWLDEGQYERAIPYYQKALDLDAQYNIRIHTLWGIGQCYEKLGMLKECVEVNDKLVEFIGDKYPSWHSWRDRARATAERLRQELESESRP
jgi:tetratricopeptide (TPR) repeat protein